MHEQVQFMKSLIAYTGRGPMCDVRTGEVEEDAILIYCRSCPLLYFIFSGKQSATSGELLANQV